MAPVTTYAQVDSTYADSISDPPNAFLTSILLSSSVVSLIIPFPWLEDDHEHSMYDLLTLQQTPVPKIDRIVYPLDPDRIALAKPASDVLAVGSVLIPLWACWHATSSTTDFSNTAIIYGAGLVEGYILVSHLKSVFDRARPYTYTKLYDLDYRLEADAWYSMPSSHTFVTAYNTYFAASILDKYLVSNDKTGLRIGIWGTATALPLLTGYLRMAAGRHFPTDVLAGYGLGAGMGLLMPLMLNDKHSYAWIPIWQPEFAGLRFSYQF